MARRQIESLFIDGPAGRLEALLEEPAGVEPVEAALVCHPHPLGGGTMHNKVVYRMARALRSRGAVVLRFNFRGVHLSQGVHDEGRGETGDARAALAFLLARYPGLPFTLAGFSFGSRVTIRLSSTLDGAQPRRLILAGYPTVYRNHELLQSLRIPRLFVHSTRDEFGPQADLQALYDRLWHPKQIRWIDAADHFFAGALDEFEHAVAGL
jgi:alpha/beta superfamily hydrolase